MTHVFTRLELTHCPAQLPCAADGRNPAFDIRFSADGEVPFPQVILHGQGRQKLIKDQAITGSREASGAWQYVASIPAGLLRGRRR